MPSIRGIHLRPRPSTIVVLLIFVAATFLRFFRLDAFPPGVQHDEVFVSNFAETVLHGTYPIFFELNRGNEPLFMYLVAGMFRLFGVNVWALRATAALTGTASIILIYLLTRELFSRSSESSGKSEWRADLIPILTLVGLAFSFWVLFESRVGLHSISTLLLASATFFAFWHGWTKARPAWLLLSGILAGLSAYTYRSGIFVPIALLLFVIWSLAFCRSVWKNNILLAPIIFLLAGLVYLPLGYYIFTHPEASLARLTDLGGDATAFLHGDPIPLLKNAVGVAGMFGISGDPEWRYNVAFRPVFDPVWGFLFCLGVVLALWRITKPERSAPYALLLIWLVVMVMPSVLSPNNPSQHRSVGAIGATFVFPAIALSAIGDWMVDRWKKRGAAIFAMGVGALAIWAAFYGLHDYFGTWPANPEVRSIYRADLAETAHWLDANAVTDRVMISAAFANDLDRGSFNLEAGRPLDTHFFSGADTFVIPTASNATYVNPGSGPVSDVWRGRFLKKETPIFSVTGGDGARELDIYRIGSQTLSNWRNQIKGGNIAISRDSRVSIDAVEMPKNAASAETIPILMWWQIVNPGFADADGLTWTIRLTDDIGYSWAETSGLGYTPSQWQPNGLVGSMFRLDVPADAPPGQYRVVVSLSSKDGVVPFSGGSNSLDAANVTLGPLEVTRGAVPVEKPALPIHFPSKAKFGDAVQLLGTDAVGEAEAGQAWRLSLFWKANATPPVDYKLRYQVKTEGGQLIEQQDEIITPSYPSQLWRTGEYIRSVIDVPIPEEAPLGKAVVRVFLVGLNGELVGRTDGVPIAGIEISGRHHEFTRPTPSHPLDARFGDTIEMIGYSIPDAPAHAGQPYSITIHWLAHGSTIKPYTAFVHLLSSDNRVIGQKDSTPLEGRAPTDSWRSGEYISDTYTFTVQADAEAGKGMLEIGFYDPAGGQRLPVYDERGTVIGDRILVEGLVIAR